MIKGISHVAISVTDIDRSIDFYTRLPGVKEQFRLTKEDGSAWLVYLRIVPGQFVELFPRASGPYQQTSNAGYAHFCLETDDIQGLHKALVDAGLTPDCEPRLGADGSWQMWIKDPDGNPFEFHEFTENSMQLKTE